MHEEASIVAENEDQEYVVPSLSNRKPQTISLEQRRLLSELRFLRNASIYNQLSPTNVVITGSADETTSEGDSLHKLLQRGDFRGAAIAAVVAIVSFTDEDFTILSLLYTRLACLILLARPDLAFREAMPFLDFMAQNSSIAPQIIRQTPWGLRLILIRLQSMSSVDGDRRGILLLHGLAGELRLETKLAHASGSQDDVSNGKAHLIDLGLYAADLFVEMGEFETASRHLASLTNSAVQELLFRNTLLALRLSQRDEATELAQQCQIELHRDVLIDLIELYESDRGLSLEAWKAHINKFRSKQTFADHLMLSMLYLGQISRVHQVLNVVRIEQPALVPKLYSVSTVFHLCSGHTISQIT